MSWTASPKKDHDNKSRLKVPSNSQVAGRLLSVFHLFLPMVFPAFQTTRNRQASRLSARLKTKSCLCRQARHGFVFSLKDCSQLNSPIYSFLNFCHLKRGGKSFTILFLWSSEQSRGTMHDPQMVCCASMTSNSRMILLLLPNSHGNIRKPEEKYSYLYNPPFCLWFYIPVFHLRLSNPMSSCVCHTVLPTQSRSACPLQSLVETVLPIC